MRVLLVLTACLLLSFGITAQEADDGVIVYVGVTPTAFDDIPGNLFVIKPDGDLIEAFAVRTVEPTSAQLAGGRIWFHSFGIQRLDMQDNDISTVFNQERRRLAWFSLSQDGEQVAYLASDNQRGHLFDLFIADASGSNNLQLTDDLNVWEAPKWSPNGEKILFYAENKGKDGLNLDEMQLYSIGADGSDLTQLTTGNLGEVMQADWSPDGERIVLAIDGQLHTMNADGGDLTQITNDPIAKYDPQWSPDGTHIAYITWPDEIKIRLHVLNLASSKSRILASRRVMAGYDWSPQGDQLIYNGWNQLVSGSQYGHLCIITLASSSETCLIDAHPHRWSEPHWYD